MWSVFFLFLILVSTSYLVWLVWQKLPNLSNINVSALPEVQVKKKKDIILKNRLKRDLSKLSDLGRATLAPTKEKVFDFFKEKYSKLQDLEKDLRRRSHDQFNTIITKSQKIENLLLEAKQFFNAGEYSKAEDNLLEALAIDQYSVEVYKLLAEVYRAKKEYEQAKETLSYLLKLTHNEDAGVFTSLAEISKVRGNLKEAEEEYLKSISLSDENHLNFLSLAEVYLELDDREQALATAQRSLLLSPNNPKIHDFLGGYQSGQLGQTVNLLASAFGGSNPSPPTTRLVAT